MKRLFRCADLNMTEGKKVDFLMRSVKDQLFAGLVRQLPKTVAEFAQESSTIKKTLEFRNRQYNHPAQLCATHHPDKTSRTSDRLREVIREVAREELRQLLPLTQTPEVAAVTDIVRQEVQLSLALRQ